MRRTWMCRRPRRLWRSRWLRSAGRLWWAEAWVTFELCHVGLSSVLPVPRRERIVSETVAVPEPSITSLDPKLTRMRPGEFPAARRRFALRAVFRRDPLCPFASNGPCVIVTHNVVVVSSLAHCDSFLAPALLAHLLYTRVYSRMDQDGNTPLKLVHRYSMVNL